ncbi:MAG: shikimate dehydrogenase [Hyphomicrobiaceae bacterium]|nr:shikimate dehydrogenase [Hyphomicrobiaceae bacterium]
MTTRIPHAGVIGWPISQSRSPLIHRYWLRQHDLAGSYERIPVAPADIVPFLSTLRQQDLVGCNVTVPHKEAAFAAARRLDPVAKAVGAVNTLWFDGDTLCGGNTDAPGFLANLDQRAPGWSHASGRAVVLGAGGAARAVIWALIDRGFKVAIVNRTLARAEDLASRFGADSTAHAWADLGALLPAARLLVNTTSLGMAGKDDGEIDLTGLPIDALVTDIVYVPLITPLLAAARARGNRIVDGLGMLLHQAAPGFEHWFGVRPSVTAELRQLILADLGVVE